MPGKLFKKILPKFNRAVIFDTSNYSWHGVEPIKGNSIRKTIAVYYLMPIKKIMKLKDKELYTLL